jgi:hypothetical protein
MVKKGDTAALARLLDQAFGRPSEQDKETSLDEELESMTRDQRALLREFILSQEASPADAILAHENTSAESSEPPPEAREESPA